MVVANDKERFLRQAEGLGFQRDEFSLTSVAGIGPGPQSFMVTIDRTSPRDIKSWAQSFVKNQDWVQDALSALQSGTFGSPK